MTMRISKDQKIGGVPAKSVRDILRKLGFDASLSQEWLAEELYWLRVKGMYKHATRDNCLWWLNSPDVHRNIYYPDCLRRWNASRRASASVIRTLVEEGFIELDEEATKRRAARYKRTERGMELCRATAAKPVHRKNADVALNEFMERVRIVNEDDRFLYRVTAVVLYGSYIRGAERPADVDLAIELEKKISDGKKFGEACWKHFYDSGRAYQRTGYEYALPRDEVFVFLRQRKRTLSLHWIGDFINMKKHYNFGYEVLFGDKDKVAKLLARPRSL